MPIKFTDDAPEDPNLTIETSSGKILAATPSFHEGSKTLMSGTYTFLCTEPGHAAGGTKGTLTVS